METATVIVLPGELLGDHVVVMVVAPAGAAQSNGVMIFEMSVALQTTVAVDP